MHFTQKSFYHLLKSIEHKTCCEHESHLGVEVMIESAVELFLYWDPGKPRTIM